VAVVLVLLSVDELVTEVTEVVYVVVDEVDVV